MRLLITGASGLYGSKLAQLSSSKGHQVFSASSQHPTIWGTPIQLDITDREQVTLAFSKAKPDVVVHAAALTDVDKCELNRELAWRVNVEGTYNVAQAAKACNAFVLYISTDYVFNGDKGCFTETDKPSPINYYGVTKLAAEEQVKNLACDFCIARPSVIYGATAAAGKINFALWLVNKLEATEQLRIVSDQWNSPTLSNSLAEMTLEIMERRITGIYHISGATRISRYEFAKKLAYTLNLDENLITPILSSEFLQPAKRPKDSSLDTAKARQALKIKPLEIDTALQKLKTELLKNKR